MVDLVVELELQAKVAVTVEPVVVAVILVEPVLLGTRHHNLALAEVLLTMAQAKAIALV
jgi:hypothetical protein